MVGGNSDSRPSRFGDRSYKPSVHNCAKLTDAEYNLLLHAIAGMNIARLKVYEFPLFDNQNLGRITRITVFVKRELSQNGVKVANVR